MSRRELALQLLLAWEHNGTAANCAPDELACEAWAIAGEYLQELTDREEDTIRNPHIKWPHSRQGLA